MAGPKKHSQYLVYSVFAIVNSLLIVKWHCERTVGKIEAPQVSPGPPRRLVPAGMAAQGAGDLKDDKKTQKALQDVEHLKHLKH